ncbi:MAG: hypothetical protein WKG07_05495 [Hymenobacter sp.]
MRRASICGARPAGCRRCASCWKCWSPACWWPSTAGPTASAFVNVAVLRGDHVRVVDEETQGLADYPALHAALPAMVARWRRQRPGRGRAPGAGPRHAGARAGVRVATLVVPPDSRPGRASIVEPLSYPVVPAYRQPTGRARPPPPRLARKPARSH